ncbi:PP2C family serine/threonine-protein phosphatase [Kozakia baliensis]|uniref:PP2C family serine/threonine-protein phosphatase n=1 Tax=Kozakia baliensis TaxID=153496 RepID=UPI0011698C10|nr:PP2C family serine/threonine-protein phosphatase [Kozakia baliensis]GBR29562.1 hypothetical protein AA0488_1767 [Kozakia baliensis NRIC 0488]GEL65646.1 hypothetical protein KBA01_29320 [Kozakia baliensis]
MRVLHRWTVGKEGAEPRLNEDAVKYSNVNGVYAVSDGASESFASRRWARILVTRYVQQPAIDETWLAHAIDIYHSAFTRATMSWSAQAAFDRGSFATLLGLKLDPQGVSILGIGDSLAVLDDGSEIQATFPYSEPDQFRANPLLLSTIYNSNSAIINADFTTHWSLEGTPKLFCMTDAIGAWLLGNRPERMARLRALQTRTEFVALVEDARANGVMRRDDTTLLVIG